LIPIPDSVSLDEAAMTEPLAVGIHAANLAAIKPGETAAILGAGAIGLSILQPLKLAGVGKVLVTDPITARRDLAAKLGADVTCEPSKAHSTADEITGGRGFDIVFECAGDVEAVRDASKLARILGRVVIVGIPREDEYPFDAGTARRKQLNAIFVRRSNSTTERAIELVDIRKIDVLSYVTHTFPLEQAGKALALAESKADGVLRAIVRVS
jgi:L-iditol 2-dehydrogenase